MACLCFVFFGFLLAAESRSAGAREVDYVQSSVKDSGAGVELWKTFPDGGGYFQQRQDAPIILIPSPPWLPSPSSPEEESRTRHGRRAKQKVVPSFIPNEAMETGAFSGGL
ncbi:MAG: hypothetical protein AB7T14_00800 [Candidatus Methylacidiphilaceae bacterium]